MTCDSFKSNGFAGEELDGDDAIVEATFSESPHAVKLVEDFDCNFMLAEEEEVFNVDGFAGTKNEMK